MPQLRQLEVATIAAGIVPAIANIANIAINSLLCRDPVQTYCKGFKYLML